MFKEISRCRICGNTSFHSIIHLGNQALTGVFPSSREQKVTVGPLELVKCDDIHHPDACGLVQLRHSYDPNEMYCQDYGYHSSLNKSMVQHLHNKVRQILETISLSDGDLVLDIGANDSTLLQAYPKENITLVGMDPAGLKFKKYYPEHILLIPDFFNAASFKKEFGERKAKIITSIAMFYDLEDPQSFMKQVHEILDDNGVWVFEQSYLLSMIEHTAYDTICHEHVEYYALKQIKKMCDNTGFRILDVSLNDVNGGSFSVMVCKHNSSLNGNPGVVNAMLEEEIKKGYNSMAPFHAFREATERHREELTAFFSRAKSENKRIFGYGASTKGNVILQYCNFTASDIPCIAEVNEDKFGSFTPHTHIPIVPESEARAMNPDYFLVLPWHFKKGITQREAAFLKAGGQLLFPLPEIVVVNNES